MLLRNGLVLLAFTGLAGVAACSSSDSTTKDNACSTVAVDRFKELIVVDEGVLSDARTSNARNGAWSFRHAVEELAGPGADTSEFMLAWSKEFGAPNSVDGYPVPSRVTTTTNFVCPWLQSRPQNICDETCDVCAERKLDLALAPFRLIAVANRFDEYEKRGGSGEGRLAFALTKGPADLAASVPLDMTVIFEFNLPTDGNRDKKFWAQRWHELGSHPDFSEAYRGDLAGVIADFVRHDNLAQVRTNERVLDWDWQLRQFQLERNHLVLGATEDTPDKSLNGADALTQFVKGNTAAVLANKHILPPSMKGGASVGNLRWFIPKVNEDVRKAFAKQTCNGCHQTEESAIDINFHVSPYKRGVERLSVYLHNPADPTSDELARRTRLMQASLCE